MQIAIKNRVSKCALLKRIKLSQIEAISIEQLISQTCKQISKVTLCNSCTNVLIIKTCALSKSYFL